MLPQVPIFNQVIKPSITFTIQKEQPKERLYTIKGGDTLTKIAQDAHTTVERLWEKNTELQDPDLIEPNKQLEIPTEAEQLADRPLPAPKPVVIVPVSVTTSKAVQRAPVSATGLIGSIGYAIPYGNCVNTARAHGKVQPGNPISWVPGTQTPFIGAAALFHYNHVGIVVGIWPNGDLEVAHENYRGGQHRFPRSEFRGFF